MKWPTFNVFTPSTFVLLSTTLYLSSLQGKDTNWNAFWRRSARCVPNEDENGFLWQSWQNWPIFFVLERKNLCTAALFPSVSTLVPTHFPSFFFISRHTHNDCIHHPIYTPPVKAIQLIARYPLCLHTFFILHSLFHTITTSYYYNNKRNNNDNNNNTYYILYNLACT